MQMIEGGGEGGGGGESVKRGGNFHRGQFSWD